MAQSFTGLILTNSHNKNNIGFDPILKPQPLQQQPPPSQAGNFTGSLYSKHLPDAPPPSASFNWDHNAQPSSYIQVSVLNCS